MPERKSQFSVGYASQHILGSHVDSRFDTFLNIRNTATQMCVMSSPPTILTCPSMLKRFTATETRYVGFAAYAILFLIGAYVAARTMPCIWNC